MVQTRRTIDLTSLKSVSPIKNDQEDLSDIILSLSKCRPKRIIGREQELLKIEAFLLKCLKTKSGCLTLQGNPGTGKTILTQHAFSNFKNDYQMIYINCLQNCKISQIFEIIMKHFKKKVKKRVRVLVERQSSMKMDSYISKICNILRDQQHVTFLIFDEIDQLKDKNYEKLYKIFQLLSVNNLAIIGICNSLNFGQDVLPNIIHLYLNQEAECITFKPYTSNQIHDIIVDRIYMTKKFEKIDKSAIELCARKISASAGDIRNALDLCSNALMWLESDTSIEGFMDTLQYCSKRKSVGPMAIMSTLNKTTQNTLLRDSRLKLPLVQKLAITSYLMLSRKLKLKNIALSKIYQKYRNICKLQGIRPIVLSDFAYSCELLESQSIFSLSKSSEPTMKKIKLLLNEKEATNSLEDAALVTLALHSSSL
ncbi:hypothetical protein A3Q56_00057 [Intoshia linei]|uniref:Cell division control protein n=1 Tax=Intoshia linei TaxID=1819745 RepID=A0A177BD01_9BILA|nr:hypothetical protein A3Q56_00057 [Intoshia linei]